METKTLSPHSQIQSSYNIQPVPLPIVSPSSSLAHSHQPHLGSSPVITPVCHSCSVTWPPISPFSNPCFRPPPDLSIIASHITWPLYAKTHNVSPLPGRKNSLKCYSRLCHLAQLHFPKHTTLRPHKTLQSLQNCSFILCSRLLLLLNCPSLLKKKAQLLEAIHLNSSALELKCDIGQVTPTPISSLINRDSNYMHLLDLLWDLRDDTLKRA